MQPKILSELSQSSKDKHHVLSLIYGSQVLYGSIKIRLYVTGERKENSLREQLGTKGRRNGEKMEQERAEKMYSMQTHPYMKHSSMVNIYSENTFKGKANHACQVPTLPAHIPLVFSIFVHFYILCICISVSVSLPVSAALPQFG